LTNPEKHDIIRIRGISKNVRRKNMEMEVVGYIRVSTQEQGKHGLSLDFQERQIKAYCEAKGLGDPVIIRDAGNSGKDLNRPGVQKVLDGIKNGEIKTVIVKDFDRLSRQTRDHLLVMDLANKNDCSLQSIDQSFDTKTPIGNFLFTLIAASSQMERELISERARESVQAAKDKGVVYNHPCFGKKIVGKKKEKHFAVDKKEQTVVDRIVALRNSGRSYQQIASDLKAEGLLIRGSNSWHPGTIFKIYNRATA
jgi:site-specific DNA recombinase